MVVKARVAKAKRAIVSRMTWRVSRDELARFFETKLEAELGPHDLKRLLDEQPDQVTVLDVRDPDGFREERLPGAVNIPLKDLDRRLHELPRGKRIVTYCWNVTCFLCTKAALLLAQKGFLTSELVGGIEAWKQAGFSVETSA